MHGFMLQQDEYDSEGDEAFSFTCNHPDHWESSNISLANLRKADFRGMTGTGCELRFLRFVLANATDLQSVTVSFNLYFIEEELQDSWMHYFLHTLLGDGRGPPARMRIRILISRISVVSCVSGHLHELRDGCVIAESACISCKTLKKGRTQCRELPLCAGSGEGRQW